MTEVKTFDRLNSEIYAILGNSGPLCRLNEKGVQAIKSFILENWNQLSREKPDLFYEVTRKTNNLMQDHNRIVHQQIVTEKVILRDFLTNPILDTLQWEVVETRKEYMALRTTPESD